MPPVRGSHATPHRRNHTPAVALLALLATASIPIALADRPRGTRAAKSTSSARHPEPSTSSSAASPPSGSADAADTLPRGEGAPDPTLEALAALRKTVRHHQGRVGISVLDLRTQKAIAEESADVALNPASNAKLLTAWAALRALGPQHRYLTGLYGKVREDRVDTLVLRGEGDPSFEHEHLYAMVSELKLAGVRMVGDIVVDQSHFDEQDEPPAFDQQPDEWASFRAPVAATSVDGNTIHVRAFPALGGQPVRARAVPSSAVVLEAAAGTGPDGSPESLQLNVSPLPDGRLRATLLGAMPADSPPVTIWRRAADPSWLVGYALADACRELGIQVHGKVRRGHPMTRELLAQRRSEPLAKLLHALGKHSDNFHAEMVFKGLGARHGAASFGDARARVFELLAEAGIDATGLRFENGSGLFDADRMTPSFLTRLLSAAARDPSVAPEFVAHLAIGGVDGTLRTRLEPLSRERTVRAKTGTLRSVTALSGYVLGRDGRPALAFALLVNDVKDAAAAVRKDLDEVVASLAARAKRSM